MRGTKLMYDSRNRNRIDFMFTFSYSLSTKTIDLKGNTVKDGTLENIISDYDSPVNLTGLTARCLKPPT